MKSTVYIIFFLVFSFYSLSAQSDFKVTDFRIAGDAVQAGDNCFQLVGDDQWSSGSIWYRNAIDLAAPLNMELKVMLGCKDNAGADGVVLVFSPYFAQTGYRGEGLGFAGLEQSLGIEIDTWLNEHLDDPVQDHIALMANGEIHHAASLAGPFVIPNIEDCKLHKLGITWNPSAKQLIITLDGVRRLSYTGDVVKEIFGGKSKVYWGITEATGRYSNRHEFCVEKIENPVVASSEGAMPSALDATTKNHLLKGDVTPLNGIQFNSGSSSLTEDSFKELDRLCEFLKKYPKHTIAINGHTDSAGDATANERLSKDRANEVASYLKQKGIAPNRIRVNGYGEKYPITSNQTSEGRQRNRRIEIRMFVPQV